MKIEIARHDRMTESGSSLLRLIQNQDMPLLDLLVRESIQNSLDAALPDARYVNVDLSVGSFHSKELNNNFDGIKHSLNKRFPDSKGTYKYICVRDLNTHGLTGPVRYDDMEGNQFGNLLKLVYEISKPQQNEGAGGSWGLGKTIYFRVGIGMVIYYSRINENGKYKSRLAACLVEDETKKDSMIPMQAGVKRGIAWWGASDGKDKTVPIDNETEINRILTTFSITPYKNDETGTTIIIPYIDEASLLAEVYATNDDKEHKPYWTGKIEDYLQVSIQRWYAPRYLNTRYKGAYLSPSVNGKKLTVSSMLPLFRVIRELYLVSTGNSLDEDAFLNEAGAELHTEDINVRDVFVPGTSTAGMFSYTKLNSAQLKMYAPDNNKSPYQQITNSYYNTEDNKNTPVVMFTRKPGMIVGYDFEGPWTKRMPQSSEHEFIVGLFVANSDNRLKEIFIRNGSTNITLEEYIRQGEKADHASWTDRNIDGKNPRVISKVQTNIIKKISAQYKEKSTDVPDKKNIGLGHVLANILLPRNDFGKIASKPPVNTGKSGVRSSKPVSMKLGNPKVLNKGKLFVDFEIKAKKFPCLIELMVTSDFKKYDSDSWENEIEKRFPLAFERVHIYSVNKQNIEGIEINPDVSEVSCDGIVISSVNSPLFNVFSGIKIESGNETNVKGVFVFSSDDTALKCAIEIKEGKV